jgi:hypothetical protein
MPLPALESLLDSRGIVATVSAVGGYLFSKVLAVYRERLRVLDYTVAHDRIGLTAQDAIFGNVSVTWQGHELRNLYATTLALENTTSVVGFQK